MLAFILSPILSVPWIGVTVAVFLLYALFIAAVAVSIPLDVVLCIFLPLKFIPGFPPWLNIGPGLTSGLFVFGVYSPLRPDVIVAHLMDDLCTVS